MGKETFSIPNFPKLLITQVPYAYLGSHNQDRFHPQTDK